MSEKIVGIRFQKFSKIYHFRTSDVNTLISGDYAVVETSRGKQLGEIVQILDQPPKGREGSIKPILRVATPRDLVLKQVWHYKEKEALEACRSKLKELKINGVKIIEAEYTFDGKRLTFLYCSEKEDSVDLSQLRKALKELYRRTKLDFRQVGPRDVAKMIGGMGACGMGIRCCSLFLTDFNPISIRMAKTQGVSLAPSEITGMCGRLRCCLFYEYDHYLEARKELPREKRRIQTPMGEGKVVSVSPLVRKILVDLGEAGMKEFSIEELQEDTHEQDEKADKPNSKSPQMRNAQGIKKSPRRRRSKRRR